MTRINSSILIRTVAGCIDLFNASAAQAARADFPGLPFMERVETVDALHGLILKDAIFALPALRLLTGMAGDENASLRERIVCAAGDAGWTYEDCAADAMDVLACLRDDGCTHVRGIVSHMTGVIGNRHHAIASRALEILAAMKTDGNAAVRINICNALGLIGQKSSDCAAVAREVLQEMKPDLNDDVNNAIERRLAEIRAAEERDFDPPQAEGRGIDFRNDL